MGIFGCKHEFKYRDDMRNTGYWNGARGVNCPFYHKRIMCPCNKCKKIFFAHCGLALKGKLIIDKSDMEKINEQ